MLAMSRVLAEGVHALQDNWAKLEEWTRSRWTQAGEVRFKWSGQVCKKSLAQLGISEGGNCSI